MLSLTCIDTHVPPFIPGRTVRFNLFLDESRGRSGILRNFVWDWVVRCTRQTKTPLGTSAPVPVGEETADAAAVDVGEGIEGFEFIRQASLATTTAIRDEKGFSHRLSC